MSCQLQASQEIAVTIAADALCWHQIRVSFKSRWENSRTLIPSHSRNDWGAPTVLGNSFCPGHFRVWLQDGTRPGKPNPKMADSQTWGLFLNSGFFFPGKNPENSQKPGLFTKKGLVLRILGYYANPFRVLFPVVSDYNVVGACLRPRI